METVVSDPVKHPNHYTGHASGIECIEVTRHMNFCRGNAIKYIWRAGEKGGTDKEVEDLRKAIKYLEFEIERLEDVREANEEGLDLVIQQSLADHPPLVLDWTGPNLPGDK
jgi:hypothetical protein